MNNIKTVFRSKNLTDYMSQSRNYSRWNVVYGLPNPVSVLEQEQETTNSTMQSAALEAYSSFAIQDVNRIL
jgi:hypothetical protein